MLVPLSQGGSPGCQEALQINAPASGRGAGQTRDKGSVRQETGFQAVLEKTFPVSTPAPCKSPRASGMMIADPGRERARTDRRMKEETDQMEEMIKMPLLQKAMEFAARKHEGQVRKGTMIPYFTHVMEAMEIVSRMTEDEEVRAAAVLHDTLEDTFTTKEELIHFFGKRVADLVAAESENKRKDRPEAETWLIRKQETIKHLSEAGPEIKMIALGDKLSNIRAMTRDYERIGEDLWKKFNNSDPILQGMYYGLLANVFGADEEIAGTPEYKEYVELCTALFSDERDGDGNLIEEKEAGNEENDVVSAHFFFADEMNNMPEGMKARALIFDRTDDEDIREIQKMAATLDVFLRTEDVGFVDVHMQFVNEPGSGDVSWEKTEDGYSLHLCAESGKHWCQVAYQLGYLMMHCLIDHLSDDDGEISWAEELICEASALELLFRLQAFWEHTPFGREDPDYAKFINEYIDTTLSDEGTSAILRCRDKDELKAINNRNLFDDRIDESHDLYHAMGAEDLLILAGIRQYEADDLLLYTHYWRSFSDDSKAVDYICRLQEKIPGCEIPAGVNLEINLENSKPTEAQKLAFGQLIQALNCRPGEFIVFSFLDSDKGEKEQIGLVFYQVLRLKDGRILAEMRLDTKDGRKMYRIVVDEEEAAAILNRILETNEVPDVSSWEDITDQMSGGKTEGDEKNHAAGTPASKDSKQENSMYDISEWLENPYWKKYYEEAPSDACREYIALEFRYSDTENEEIAEEMDALLETLRAEDLRHLAAYAGNNPQKAAFLKRAEALENQEK